MKRSGICIALVFAVLCSLTGCENASGPAYDPQSYSCTLSIHSITKGDTDPFTAQFVTDNGTTRLTVTAPASVSGVGFTMGSTGTSMTFSPYGGTDGLLSIPLSESVAASLRDLTSLLSCPHEEATDKRKSDAGTVLVFELGELTLNEAGLPVFARTNEGRAAHITYPPEISTESP